MEINAKCRDLNYNSSSIRGGVALRRRGVNYKDKARLVPTNHIMKRTLCIGGVASVRVLPGVRKELVV